MTSKLFNFASADDVQRELAYLCKPTNSTPVECADEHLWISNGSDCIKFRSASTPYMRGPMNALGKRKYQACIVMGPARSGKTKAMVEGFINYTLTQAAGDMLLIYSTVAKAEQMSKADLARCLARTEPLSQLMTGRKADNNIRSKRFKTGTFLILDSATQTSLSASTYRYVGITDYDRAGDEVGEEGSKFSLALKRIQNAKSGGMAMVESSPGRLVMNPEKTIPAHAAQTCSGIAELYNQGDRRRLYWQCPGCSNWFRPDWETLCWDTRDNHQESSATVFMVAPCCGLRIEETQKITLNNSGQDFAEGEIINGKPAGKPLASKFYSFAFEGPAATYQNWASLVYRYLVANDRYEKTGDEAALTAFFNVDIGRPYILKSRGDLVGPHELMARAEPYDRKVIPDGVCFLVAAIDVQNGKNSRFEVQVSGYGEHLQKWVIDRFEITTNERRDARIDPTSYAEDWDLLIDKVIKKTYTIPDDDRVMKIALTVCDSGGASSKHNKEQASRATSVTDMAYSFHRRLKSRNLDHLFRLVKGASRQTEDIVNERFPDSKIARGDIPLLLLDTDRLKNRVAASFERETIGENYFHLPGWCGVEWYEELTAEYINEKTGRWECDNGVRNESFDLCCYAEAAAIYLGIDGIDWAQPPAFASADFDRNINVTDNPVFERKLKRKFSKGLYS